MSTVAASEVFDQAARLRLTANERGLEQLRHRASTSLDAGRPELAAAWVQAAAAHAWFRPAGRFADAALESMLLPLAAAVPSRSGRARHGGDGRVLHVVTQAYQTGGSTQFVASWVDQDASRGHLVCLTRQGPVALPRKLLDREGPQLALTRVDGVRGLLRRAAEVRELARTSDLVLVHAHPHDVVPGLAFAGVPDLPPVVYVNHADHVFWLGTQVTSVLLNMRRSGAALAIRRRGVDAARCATLARPLAPRRRTTSRTEAKAALGLQPDQLVVATVADGSKYRPVSGPSLLELVLPVLSARPEAVLLAAGPEPEGEWAAAGRATGGRVRALGLLDDPFLVQQAADVYLDSFPFSSLTSLLEVGSLGTPAVTYAGHPEGCEVFGADTPDVEEHVHRPSTPAELVAILGALLDDAHLRVASGEAVQQCIVDSHTGVGWRSGLEQLLEEARHSTLPPPPGPVGRREDEVDLLVSAVMRQTAWGSDPGQVLRSNLSTFPAGQRLGLATGLVRSGTTVRPADLLPDHARPVLARVRGAGRALLVGR